MIEFLNQNSGAFSLIFSGVVALATVIYAILTWKLVSETRKMRAAQTEPKVSVIMQPREEFISFIDMIIQNIGLGPAYNIKFMVKPDFEYEKGKYLSGLGFIKNGINYLAPNQKIQLFLTNMIESFDEKSNKSFEIKVVYQNSIGKTNQDLYLIDFSQLVGLCQLGEPPLYKIAKNIESIQNVIHNISTGLHKMKVIMYTKNEIEEENNQLLERIKKKASE